ncbi:hypothetical protein CLU79DRAFT_719829 [Phycomyces nitens]|nr:hypothetical protein CLU79DRAFT_719829 [Phycomyces nitens]
MAANQNYNPASDLGKDKESDKLERRLFHIGDSDNDLHGKGKTAEEIQQTESSDKPQHSNYGQGNDDKRIPSFDDYKKYGEYGNTSHDAARATYIDPKVIPSAVGAGADSTGRAQKIADARHQNNHENHIISDGAEKTDKKAKATLQDKIKGRFESFLGRLTCNDERVAKGEALRTFGHNHI